MVINDREVVFKALVGSHNYNLNTETSDKDYKYFVLPTFEDIYYNKTISKNVVSEDVDYTVHDIRKLPMLWWKTNINFVEPLFSREVMYNKNHIKWCEFIFSKANDFATMNLPYLYDACRGMSITKQKDMIKDSPARHENFEKYGYDPKSACHAYRVLDFLDRMYLFDFDFKCSMWYGYREYNYNVLMELKLGQYSLEDAQKLIKCKEEDVAKLADIFHNKEPNEMVYDILKNSVYSLVHSSIKRNM